MSIITYPLDGKYYNAQDAETYLCTRTSGVFSQDISFTPNGMNITVSPFLAWIKNDDFSGKSVAVTTDTTLTISPSEPILSRIDRIVLRFDARKNGSELMVLKGTPSSSPAVPSIERTPVIYDLCLCQISVKPSATSISAGDITSTLLDESLCGIMRDGVTGIPTLQLQSQAQDLIRELEVAISMAENGSPVLQSLGIKRGTVDVTIGIEGQKIYKSNDVTFDTTFLDTPKVIVTRKNHYLNDTVFKYIKPQESVSANALKFSLEVFSEKDIPSTLTLRYDWIAIGKVSWDNDSGGGNGGGGDGGGDGGGEEDDTEYFTISTSVDPAGSGITEGAGNFAKGSKTTLVAQAFSGYMFEGWYSGNSKVTSNAEYTVTVNSNATYTAKFIESVPVPSIFVQINVEPVGTGTVSGAGTYEKGSTVNLGATPKEGYEFVGWYVGNTKYASTPDYSVTLNTSTTFTAKFEEEVVTPDYYTVIAKVTPTGSGTVTGGGQYVPGATAKLKATANEGYAFSHWSSGTETIDSAEFTFVVSSDRTWIAHFIEGEVAGKVTITTSVEPANSGTVTGGGKVNKGSMSAVQANANSGYKFKHWRFEDGTTKETNPYLFKANTDKTLVAVFEQGDFYTITVQTNNANYGTVSGGGSYEKGSTAILTATPANGYVFKHWILPGGYTDTPNPLDVAVTGNLSFTAVFEAVSSGEPTYTSDTIVDGVLNVGTQTTNIETDNSYAGRTDITQVIIPEGRTRIAYNCFSNCSNLTSVTIPVSLTQIGSFAFDLCKKLTKIHYNGTKSQWNSISINLVFFDLAVITVQCSDGNVEYCCIKQVVTPSGAGSIATIPSGSECYKGMCFIKGSSTTFTATKKSGYVFSHWSFSDDSESGNNPCTKIINQDITATAVFVPTTCTVTTEVSPTSSGTVTGGGTYTSGSTATLSATAIDGYRFSYWEFDDGSNSSTSDDNPCYKTVNKDFTATAVFINVANGVTYKISSRNAGTGDTIGLYPYSHSTDGVDLSKPLGTETTLYVDDPTVVFWYAKPGSNRMISSVESLADGVLADSMSGEDLNDYIENGALSIQGGWYDPDNAGKTFELVVYFTSDSSGGTHTITIGAFDGHQDRGSVKVYKDGNDVTNAQNQYLFNIGDAVTVEAIPNSGKKFTTWSINDGESYKSNNPYTFTVATNINKVGVLFSA